MPYVRKRVQISRRSKKPVAIRRKGTRAIAKRAERQVKAIKRGFETKYFSNNFTTALSAAGAVTHMTTIAQGDTALTRDGNKLTLKSCIIKASFVLSPDAGGATLPDVGLVRFIVFQDTQQVADGIPAVTDVLETASATSLYNKSIEGPKRFKILWDKLFTIPVYGSSNVTATNQLGGKVLKRWIFPTRKQVYYNGPALTDIQRNGLYFLVIKAGNSNVITPGINWQVSFTDN